MSARDAALAPRSGAEAHDPAPRRPGPPSWLDECADQVEADLDYLLSSMPESRVEAQKLCLEVLGTTLAPELLQTLQLMARTDAEPLLARGLGRRLVLLRLLTDAVVRHLEEPTLLEPQFLRRLNLALPDLAEHLRALRREIDAVEGAAPRERERLEKLRRTLMPSCEEIESYEVVVAWLEPLADAAMHGRILAVAHLDDRETALFADAIPGRIEVASPPVRAWLDAVALRYGIEEDLEAWDRARKDSAAGHASAGDPRAAILARIKADLAAYKLVAGRLQRHQDQAKEAGRADVARRTTEVQKALLASYLRLSAAARNPDAPLAEGAPAASSGATASRRRPLEEARCAPETVRGTTEATRANRWRKRLFFAVALGLVVAAIAAGAALVLHDRRRSASPPAPTSETARIPETPSTP